MNLKLIILLFVIGAVKARISINVNVDQYKNISISYSGIETSLITNDDVKSFKIENEKLLQVLRRHLGKRPNNAYLKSPTPWGDLFKTYKWEQVRRTLSIKSARATSITKNSVVVLSQDFENASNQTIKVNTGITHTVENSLTTSWSKEREFTVTQEIEYECNVILAEVHGMTGFSYTTKWGVSEERTKTETIGTSSGMETELQPGQAVTAVLSANAGNLEIEVVHKASIRGNVAVNYRKAYNGHHFWGPTIQDVMETGGISNEITMVETIQFGFYVDASLKVYDKKTGLPV